MIYYNYRFLRQLLLYLLPSLTGCIRKKKKKLTKLSLFHGCSDKIKVGEGSKQQQQQQQQQQQKKRKKKKKELWQKR